MVVGVQRMMPFSVLGCNNNGILGMVIDSGRLILDGNDANDVVEFT
jgi:hypothetical protein